MTTAEAPLTKEAELVRYLHAEFFEKVPASSTEDLMEYMIALFANAIDIETRRGPAALAPQLRTLVCLKAVTSELMKRLALDMYAEACDRVYAETDGGSDDVA